MWSSHAETGLRQGCKKAGRRLRGSTLDFELYAALPIYQLQVLIREPGALEWRHDYVIAAIDPQRMHCTDMSFDPLPGFQRSQGT